MLATQLKTLATLTKKLRYTPTPTHAYCNYLNNTVTYCIFLYYIQCPAVSLLAGYISLYLLLSLYSTAIGITQQKLYLPIKHVQSNFKASYSNEMWWDLKIKSFVTWLVYYMSDVTP